MSSGFLFYNVSTIQNYLFTWGRDNYGQLGDGTTVSKSSPIQTIAGGTAWSAISCGYHHMAAIRASDNTLWTWGRNTNGQLGDNTVIAKSSPVQTVAGGNTWKSVACGYQQYTTAIKTDGTLWTWGNNAYGQLGTNSITYVSSPVQTVAGGTTWSSVTCGTSHTAAIKTDGTLWIWGRDQYGQLGDNTVNAKSSPVQTVAGGTTWKQVSGGQGHTAAIKTDGTLWIWGYNNFGQLGDNTTANKSSPVQTVPGGTTWNYVSCGSYHTAAIKTDGTLWTWGKDNYGQLGDNTTVNKSSPIQTVAGGTTWNSVMCGSSTLATKTDGSLWTWGYNLYGVLGDNTTTSKSSPIQIAAGSNNSWSIIAGGSMFAAGIRTYSGPVFYDIDDFFVKKDIFLPSQGTLWLWGNDSYGQLGDNTSVSKSSPVQTIATGANWTKSTTTMAGGSTVIIRSDGTLWAWGINNAGTLGDNTTTRKSSPVQTIAGGTNWSQAALGMSSQIAAIKTDGTLWVWGNNVYGALGDNTTTNKSSPIQTVTGGTNWSQVACAQNTMSIKTDGTLWGWGRNNYGQIGDNTSVNKSSPVQNVAGGTNWAYVSTGGGSTSSIKTDGTLWTWGLNLYGQLGDNTITNRSSPVQTVTGGTNWKNVACGYGHIAAIKTDGTLWTWGWNTFGQLGDNTTTNRSSPVQTVAGSTNWKNVACGYGHMAATKTDGTLWIWGSNSSGQLGDNTTTNRSSPVQTVAGGTNWTYVLCGSAHTAAFTF